MASDNKLELVIEVQADRVLKIRHCGKQPDQPSSYPGWKNRIGSRQHYAKWSAARQERISTIMRLVQGGETAAAATPQAHVQRPPVIN